MANYEYERNYPEHLPGIVVRPDMSTSGITFYTQGIMKYKVLPDGTVEDAKGNRYLSVAAYLANDLLKDPNYIRVGRENGFKAIKKPVDEYPPLEPEPVYANSVIVGPTLINNDSIKIKGSPPINPSVPLKYDDNKVDWSLVPFEALEGMVQVLQFGAKKYSANNWRNGGGFKWLRVCSSTMRHLFAFMRGEDVDPESGLSHIYHAQCNLLFLAYFIRNKDKVNNDDRYVP